MPAQEAMASLLASFGYGSSQRGASGDDCGKVGMGLVIDGQVSFSNQLGGTDQPAKRVHPSSMPPSSESSELGTCSGVHQGVIQTIGSNAGQLWQRKYEQLVPHAPSGAESAPKPIGGKWRGGGGEDGGLWSGTPTVAPGQPNGWEIPTQSVGLAQMMSERTMSGGFGNGCGAGGGGLSGAGAGLSSLSRALSADMTGGLGMCGLAALVGSGDPLGGRVRGGADGRSLKRSCGSVGPNASSHGRLGGGSSSSDVCDLAGMAPLPLDASKSFNLSGNLNLYEFLRSNSLSDLGLGFGSLPDLDAGSQKSLSFSNKEQLRAANVSDLSLSGILGENASDLVANLTSPAGGVRRQGSHNSSAGSAHLDRDIIGEFINDEPIAS